MSTVISVPPQQLLERILTLEIVRVTERAAVSAARPAEDYTARVIPQCDGVAIPLEDARILWQR